MSNSQGMHSPVAQFEIKPIFDLSIGGGLRIWVCPP